MTTARLQGKKILIVDDDEDILSSIDLAMRAEGASTETVTDGNAAVNACDNGPDVVVLDMMLPKRSGFLVLERLKQQVDSPVVVMITANQGKRHMAYAESLGVDAYLVKPVPLQRLVETVVRLLLDSNGRAEGGDPEQTQ
ncbi:MAG: response regulator transcription factor [Planctomycetota bacterium]|jgi:DNA-binding response OmpR family regulator